jgi:D-alanyl-D-alanine carboxypeptidase (penicillin-binding protein 5/6)
LVNPLETKLVSILSRRFGLDFFGLGVDTSRMAPFCFAAAARRLAAFPMVISALALSAAPMAARAQVGFPDGKFAAIVMEADTGKVLYARNPDSRRYPASLTKVMTLYLAFDALSHGRLKLTDRVTVSRHAADQRPTRIGLRPGQSITVQDAINVIAVKSANDAAAALAERIGGSEANFAEMMTRKAHELGMTETRFYNASGLPDDRHVSSARDLAILGRAVVRDFPQYYGVFGQKQTTFRGRYVPGHDHLLAMQGVDGMKTGYTVASGFNLISSGVRDGRRIVAVVLGGATSHTRDRFMQQLLLAGFDAAHASDHPVRPVALTGAGPG